METTRKISGITALAAVLWLSGGALQGEELAFSTLFGGEDADYGIAVAVDARGNTYMTGFTDRFGWISEGAGDAYVVKVGPSGELVYSIRLGGRGAEEGTALAATRDGTVWVAGWTSSPDFPIVNPGEMPPASSGWFLARLDAEGSLLFSTIFEAGSITGLGLDVAENLYVGGTTSDPGFPPGTDSSAGVRGYVLKIDPAGPRVLWSAAVPNPDSDWPHLTGFTVDPSGRAYLAWSSHLVRLLPSGALDYMAPAHGVGIAADADGNAYQLSHVPRGWYGSDVQVVRLGPAGELESSFTFGGSWDDWARGIAIDSTGHVYVTGQTQSEDFPLIAPVEPECAGSYEWLACFPIGFLVRFRPGGLQMDSSTFIGGGYTAVDPNRDYTMPLDVAANVGTVAVTGWTADADFTLVNAFQPWYGGVVDAFLVGITSNRLPDCSPATAAPTTLWPPDGRMVPVSILGVTDPDGGPVTLRVTAIHQDEPLSGKGPDATGLGTARPMLRASRAGNGNGRVYHIAFEATDPAGALCSGTVTVCVPHDRGKPACGDGGPLFNSTGGL